MYTHRLSPHAFADDTQIYGLCRPGSTDDLSWRVSNCVDDVTLWMRANRLQLNPSKMEVLWCSSGRRQHQIQTTAIHICSTFVQPATTVRNLGVFRHRRQHESAHRRHRPIVFRCSPAGAQRTAVFTTSGLADTHQALFYANALIDIENAFLKFLKTHVDNV